MITELKRLHGVILASLDELDVLTAQPDAQMDRLPAVRLTLTRASRARTMPLERLYNQLILQSQPERKAAIQALKDQGKDNLILSVQHIGSWTLREIAKRWPEYCIASKTMRSSMRQRIKKEVALIYPFLSEPERAPRLPVSSLMSLTELPWPKHSDRTTRLSH